MDWMGMLNRLHSFQSGLEAESGLNATDACNPLEYDSLGQRIERTDIELGINSDIEFATDEVLTAIAARRKQLNECCKRFTWNLRCEASSFYSREEIRVMMAAFAVLDENDDLLIDIDEFVAALVHFNPKTNRNVEHDIFTIADKGNTGVIDFEEFVTLCAILDGHIKVSNKAKYHILHHESCFADFLKQQRHYSSVTDK